MTAHKMLMVLLCLFSPVLLNSCARSPTDLTQREILYLTPQPAAVKDVHTPIFLIKKPEQPYNRIGTPSVRESADQVPDIFVNPDRSAVFFEIQEFTTAKGRYQNLVYRIHFEQVPFALNKWNLTAGKNTGILIIYTLDENETLLLVTTVHTCGCFLAFFPTEALPVELFPSNWPDAPQWVYGYRLPSQLNHSRLQGSEKIVFTLESETHRISDVAIAEYDILKNQYDTVAMDLLLMSALYQLPYNDSTESFFELDGPREGYVKNNTKWMERLLISWWAFDLNVGEDKAFGSADSSETILYTSLKFWARKASDLKNFPQFLSYWGWKF
ncbi:MAG: hypothetical protein WBB19_00795 [Desulforhopalus sp.]